MLPEGIIVEIGGFCCLKMRKLIVSISLLLGGITVGILTYGSLSVLKFSPLSFSRPEACLSTTLDDHGTLICRGGIIRSREPVIIRLFAPDALIDIRNAKKRHRIFIENLFRGSKIIYEGKSTISQKSRIGITVGNGTVRIIAPRKTGISFIALGDVECSKDGDVERLRSILIRLIERTEADFAILLGDIVRNSPRMLKKVSDMLADLQFPSYTVVGNHDFSSTVFDSYCRHFAPMNYQFVYSDILFLFFNNADEFPPACLPSSEMDAVVAKLKNTSAKSIIFLCHKPLEDPRPGCHHHMNRHSAAELLRKEILRAGVDAVLSGHIGVWHIKKEQNTIFVIAGGSMKEDAKAALVTISGDGGVSIKPIPIWNRKTDEKTHP